MQIFESDRFNEHYHVLTFIIGMLLSSIPYLLITSLLSSAIGHFLIGLHRGPGHFSYLFLDLLTSLLVSESCMKNVAIIVGNSYNGMVIGSCIQVRASLVYIIIHYINFIGFYFTFRFSTSAKRRDILWYNITCKKKVSSV